MQKMLSVFFAIIWDYFNLTLARQHDTIPIIQRKLMDRKEDTVRILDVMQKVDNYLYITATLKDVAEFMLDTRNNTIPIGDKEGKLVGVFTRGAFLQLIVEESPLETPIAPYMIKDVRSLPADMKIEAAGIHNSPFGTGIVVDEENKIVGLLTQRDLVLALSKSTMDLREQMEVILSVNNSEYSALEEGAGARPAKISERAQYVWEDIITRDSGMKQLINNAAKAAKKKTSVLLRGESGTGKEMFAHAIHHSSNRSEGPFILINCASIPEHLLESELFGYVSGAFTGAEKGGKTGKWEAAHGGTLFLDEIGEMSLALQAKLLRVIEGKGFFRLGSNEQVHVDVRVISATNAPLEEMIHKKTFREDLFYRLNVISFTLPALRNRKTDIPILAHVMIKHLNHILETTITGMDEEVVERLNEYRWPGNIRELRNALERAMVMRDNGKISVEDLPEYLQNKQPFKRNSIRVIQEIEKEEIENALTKTGGNKTKAARILGMSRSVLYEKLKKHQT